MIHFVLRLISLMFALYFALQDGSNQGDGRAESTMEGGVRVQAQVHSAG